LLLDQSQVYLGNPEYTGNVWFGYYLNVHNV
jgi:hypothetical protein